MKLLKLVIFSCLFSLANFAQDNTTENKTIESQLDYLYRTSTNYQVYKVISKQGFLNLKTAVLDSISAAKKTISEKEHLIQSQNDSIKELKNNINQTKIRLDDALSKEDSISLFGLKLSKIWYNLILWILILLLITAAIFYFFKFKNSHVFTKEARENLKDVELEFEEYRKKTLLNEQKLRRQLQDEINKHK